MGLFDFALRPGQRFNKEEIRILDQNFNSISAYTKKSIDLTVKLLLMILMEAIMELITIKLLITI